MLNFFTIGPDGVGGVLIALPLVRRLPELRTSAGLFLIRPGDANRLSRGAVRPCTQGCSNACSAVYRLAGSVFSRFDNKSLADELKFLAQRGYRS